MSAIREWSGLIGKPSFAGVIFELDSTTGSFGRRGTLHEFPFKDTGVAEDVGRKAREISINAYVDGDDYLARRSALISAIQDVSTPQELVLSTGERLMMKPTDGCSFTDSNQEGGITRFSLSFIEAGKSEFPQATTNTKETVKENGAALASTITGEAAANINFENTKQDSSEGVNDPDTFADESNGITSKFTDSIDTALTTGLKVGAEIDTFTRELQAYKDEARGALLTPQAFFQDTDALYSAMRKVWPNSDLPNAFDAFRDVFNSSVDNIAKIVSIGDPSRLIQDKNNQALRDGTRNILLRQMAGVTADQNYISTNEVNQRRADILSLFDQQIENAGNNHDRDQRDALVQLRSSVVSDLNSKVGTLPDEVTFTPPDTLAAFAAANDLYGDGLRGEEIANSNQVINPNLMPAQEALKVLSS